MKKIKKLFILEIEIDDEIDGNDYYETDEIDIDETDLYDMIQERIEDMSWNESIISFNVWSSWIQNGQLRYMRPSCSEESAKKILEMEKERKKKRKEIA